MNFAERVHAAVERHGHPVVVGIDPHLALLPDAFAVARDARAPRAERADALARFGCELIDAIADRAGCVKPQSAFFELFGADGARAWETVVAHARDAGLVVVGDVKRGDISSTAAAYAEAHLARGPGRCDAVTLNPYLGDDSIEPFLPWVAQGSGIYVLVRTSNPGSAVFQRHGEPPLASLVATRVDAWGRDLRAADGWSSVGAVVGATQPAELAQLRALMPHTPLLLPGVGAQGGRAADVQPAFSDPEHPLFGALVNSSRGIAFAYRSSSATDWRNAARAALDDLAGELGSVLR